MYGFFSNDWDWKSYIIENLVVVKMLHDRGFNVNALDINEPILTDILDILFGADNVEWSSYDSAKLLARFRTTYKKLKTVGVFDGLNKEDVACYVDTYLARNHYIIKVRLDGMAELYNKLFVGEFCQLIAPLRGICCSLDSEEILPFYELMEEAEWLKDDTGKVIGFWLHFVDVKPFTEYPISDLRYHEAFVEFWDILQTIKKEVLKNRNNDKNPKKWRHVSGSKRIWGNQRKTDRSKLPNKISRRCTV